MNDKPRKCQHETCSCMLDSSTAIDHSGSVYCSERCADGRGCDHADCNCGAFVAETVPGEFSPAQ